jgi:flagellar motility protein MotE (MotC chaperone)
MKTTRMLTMLVALGAVPTIAGLGSAWLAAANAAGADAAAPPPDAACAADERAFRALVETVRAKSDELVRREAELKAREAGLAATRKLVSSEVVRLEAVAKALGITGGPGAGVSIARVYETMSAEDAAPILDRLDDGTLRTVLARMRERQVGAILAAMNRDRAVAVTKAFAGPPLPPSPVASPPTKQ